MSQRTIAPRPDEQPALAEVRRFAAAHGFAILYTTNGKHDPDGWHPLGLAADLAAAVGPTRNSPELLTINLAIDAEVPHRFIKELIYGGPGNICIRNGETHRYSADVMRAHEEHVHWAVSADYHYQEVTMSDDAAPFPNPEHRLIAAFAMGDGYVMVAADGAAYCRGCEYKGGLHWDGQQWVER